MMISTAISEDIHVVIGGNFPACNTIVILDQELSVIDPGCSFDSLRSFLRNKGLEIRDIKNVILSHIHPDHITHAAKIQRLSTCDIYANEITSPLFNDKEQMKQFLGFVLNHPIRGLWEELVQKRMYGALDDGKLTVSVKDDEKLQIGNQTLKMVMTPGHTPDHMCIGIENLNLLYTSDIDCTPFGPYYGHPNSSIPEFAKSIREIVSSEYIGIISGHLENPLIYDYRDKVMRYWNQVLTRENIVFEAIKNGASSVLEITMNPIIYPSLSNLVYLQFETWMIEHHITSLLKRGLVSKTDKGLEAI